MPARRAATPVLAVATLCLSLFGCTSPTDDLASAEPESTPTSTSAAARLAAPPPRTSRPTSTTPQPVVEVQTITETQPVPFARVTRDDATMARGTTAIVTAGVNGVRTLTYRVTLTDGVETAREVVSDVVTTPAVDEVTAVGTYEEPPDPPAGEDSGCDPNYSGACVPIASDVDCAGGSGNGPEYVDGPVYVVGTDIYGLDNDGDGVGCES